MNRVVKGNKVTITCGPPAGNPCPKCGHESRKVSA